MLYLYPNPVLFSDWEGTRKIPRVRDPDVIFSQISQGNGAGAVVAVGVRAPGCLPVPVSALLTLWHGLGQFEEGLRSRNRTDPTRSISTALV